MKFVSLPLAPARASLAILALSLVTVVGCATRWRALGDGQTSAESSVTSSKATVTLRAAGGKGARGILTETGNAASDEADDASEAGDSEGSLAEPANEAETARAIEGLHTDNGHISDLGGESALEPEAEQEVEATSVGDIEVKDKVSSISHVPIVMNDRVRWWIDYYTGRGRERFQTHLDRADAFQPLIQGELREAGVADALFYIALIESGFSTRARSHAGAVGVWQFIRGTGRRYGLAVSRGIDERKDPVRSTQAAARYLGDLYNIFNDWYLAFAAYNCGEFRVMRAIVKGQTRDFWELSERQLIPKETRHYVPKFLAALAIATNRQKYGFTTNAVDPMPAMKAVEVSPGTLLSDVSRATGVALSDLTLLNPHLLEKRVPKRGRSYAIWVPAAAAADLTASNLAGLPPMPVLADDDSSKDDDSVVEFHRVARGETLAAIAREYGTTVRKLRELNRIQSSRALLRVGQKLRVSGTVAPRPLAATQADGPASAGPSASGAGREFVMYRVRNGDSLNKIGRRFGVGPSRIKEVNALARNHLYAGEVIRVPTGG